MHIYCKLLRPKYFYIILDYFLAERIEDEEVEEKLTEELKGMNIERLQLELNAVMMFGPEMQPDWRWVRLKHWFTSKGRILHFEAAQCV